MAFRVSLAASILCLVLATQVASAQIPVFTHAGPNVNIAPDDTSRRQQVEPDIAIDPVKPDIIAAGAQDYRGAPAFNDRWDGIYRSTDGGASWTSSLLPGFPTDTSPEGLASPLHGFGATTDPVVAMDRFGNAFLSGIAFNESLPLGVGGAVFAARYTDHGAKYDRTVIVDSGGAHGGMGPGNARFEDKNWVRVDNTPGSPCLATVYVTWNIFNAPSGQAGVYFSRSTDHGLGYSSKSLISQGIPQNGASAIATGPKGELFIVWIHFTGKSAVQPAEIFLAKSPDCGETFTAPRAIRSLTSIPSPLPNNEFRVGSFPMIAVDDSMGPFRGTVYVTWSEWNGVDADVMAIASTDGGDHWSTPVKVDDDGIPGAHQFMPAIAASASGAHVVFYDFRNDHSGFFNQSLDLYYAQSIDGGKTFLRNVRITSESFNPNLVPRIPISPRPFLGDYIGVAATDTGVHPIWTDNRNVDLTATFDTGRLNQDVLTATITA